MYLGLYATGAKDTTQEEDNIFVLKDIGEKVKMSRDVIDKSMQPQTPSNGSSLGSISTGIATSSMLSYSRDSDEPMTVSSGQT